MKRQDGSKSAITSVLPHGSESIWKKARGGLAIERRGRGSKDRPPKQLPKEVEEDLLAEVQRLRAENDYLKNLQALVLEDERRQHKKRW